MKPSILTKLFFGSLLLTVFALTVVSFRTNGDLQITFKLKISNLPKPDSVAVYWYLSPLQKGTTSAGSAKGLFLMHQPDADGLYHLSLSFPDLVRGKTLFYRYATAPNQTDIWRRVSLDSRQIPD